MSRTLKSTFIIAAAIIIIGLMLIVAGVAMGGFKNIIFGSDGIHVDDNNKKQVVNEEYQHITSINVDVDLREVVLKKGDTFKVECHNTSNNTKIKVTEKNGELTVKEKSKIGFNLNIFGFHWGTKDEDDLIITYPEHKMKDVTISADSGTIQVSDLVSDNINLNTDLGEQILKNVNAKSIKTTADSGTIELKNVHTDSLEFKASLGEIKAEKLIARSVTGSADSGSVNIHGKITGPVDINTDLGEIDMDLVGSEDAYSFELKTDLGEVELNGKDYGNNLIKEYENKPLIKAYADSGSISIDFKSM